MSVTAYKRGVAVSSIAATIMMAVSLVIVMFAARILSREELGAFFLFMMIVQITSSIGDLGLRNTSIKYLTDASESESFDLTQIILSIAFLGALSASAIIYTIKWCFYLLSPSSAFAKLTNYLPATIYILILYQIVNSIIIGSKRFSEAAKIAVYVDLMRFILSVTLLLLSFGPIALVLGNILAYFCGLCLSVKLLPKGLIFKLQRERLAELGAFSSWLYITSIASIICTRIADSILTRNLGQSALAVFGTAMQIPSAIQRIFDAVRPVIMSYASSLSKSDEICIENTTRLLALVITMPSSILICFSSFIVKLLFSEKYFDSAQVLSVLLVWISVSLINYYLAVVMISRGEVKKVFLTTLPQIMSMLLLTAPLLRHYGALGAGAALLITAMLGNVFVNYLIAEKRGGYLFWQLQIIVLKFMLPLLVLVIVSHNMALGYVGAVFALIIFIASLVIVKGIVSSDVEIFKQIARKVRSVA